MHGLDVGFGAGHTIAHGQPHLWVDDLPNQSDALGELSYVSQTSQFIHTSEGGQLISAADFKKSEDELFLELADQLVSTGHIRPSAPLDDRSKREQAKKWLDSYLAGFRLSICGDPRVVAYLQDDSLQNQVEIAGLVVDCLSATSVGFPLGTLAVLVVKGRLRALCS